jgi:hypothetical protein
MQTHLYYCKRMILGLTVPAARANRIQSALSVPSSLLVLTTTHRYSRTLRAFSLVSSNIVLLSFQAPVTPCDGSGSQS